MKYYKIDPENPRLAAVEKAAKVLKTGGIIVYPTDTLYGLGIDPSNNNAIQKLYTLKGRLKSNPVSLMVDSIDTIEAYSGPLSEETHHRLMKLLPGKFTALLENTISPNRALYENLGKQNKIGWRIPDNYFCNMLSIVYGKPISTTSANISGKDNVTDISQVLAHFGNKLDLVIDSGPVKNISGSTIIDFTKTPLMIVREGEVKKHEIQALLNESDIRIKKDFFNIVFVCSGNICRSPMAEGILKAMMAKTRFRNIVRVSSAGTLQLPPNHAHELAEKIADANEINIHSHLSRHITQTIVDEADIIISMAVDHVNYLRKHFPNDKHKFILLKEWKRTRQLSKPSVADPIGHDINFFSDTFAELHSEIKRILPFIFAELKKSITYNEIEVK